MPAHYQHTLSSLVPVRILSIPVCDRNFVIWLRNRVCKERARVHWRATSWATPAATSAASSSATSICWPAHSSLSRARTSCNTTHRGQTSVSSSLLNKNSASYTRYAVRSTHSVYTILKAFATPTRQSIIILRHLEIAFIYTPRPKTALRSAEGCEKAASAKVQTVSPSITTRSKLMMPLAVFT